MILASSERGTVVDTKNSQMGETAVATKEGELSSLSRNFDLSEFAYPNREVVNFENASVNIDNSNDVIIGPVTQFNVNGNVTIVQNGIGEDIDEENSEKKSSSTYGTDVPKARSRLHCFLLFLNLHWIVIRNCLIAGTIIFVIVVITVIVLENQYLNEIYDNTFEDPFYNDSLSNHSVVYRNKWGGHPPKSTPIRLKHPVDLVIISCDLKDFCNTSETCSSAVKELQEVHQTIITDIGYNFMIGGDGRIYVGTGWDYRNFHKKTSIGIDFLGHFLYDELTEDMIDALQELIKQGLQLNKISKDYKLLGENQTDPHMYLSPGPNVVKFMKNWPHFYNNTWF